MKKKLMTAMLIMAAIAQSSCSKDDYIPPISQDAISPEELHGGWQIDNFQVLWDLTTYGKTLNSVYSFKSKTRKYVREKLDGVSLYFANDSLVFRIRHLPEDDPPYCKYSHYHMSPDSNSIELRYDDLMGFYCKRIYVKHDEEGRLVLYLRKGECLDMIDKAGEVGGTYMHAIRKNVKSTEVDIFLSHDTLPVYAEIEEKAAKGYFDEDPENYYD